MKNSYNTIGDVRADVDELFNPQGLQTVGGSYFPLIRGIRFGLVDKNGSRVGDASCALPNGGWLTSSYWPNCVGEPTRPSDELRLKVMKGSGTLAVRDWGGQVKVDTSTDVRLKVRDHVSQQYHILNPGAELLVVHAISTEYPTNWTDINPSHTRVLDDSRELAPDITFRHEDAFQPDGTVSLILRDS